MKPTYEELETDIAFLKVEIAQLRYAVTGRTMSCCFCNNSAKERDKAIKERDEAIKERDEARATVAEMRDDISIWDVQMGDKWHYAYRIPDSQLDKSTPMPAHEFREATQQDVEKIKDIKLLEAYKNYLQVEDDPSYKGLKNINLKSNGKNLGTFELDVDGIWNYYSNGSKGAYPDYFLLGIGALLFELNWKDA